MNYAEWRIQCDAADWLDAWLAPPATFSARSEGVYLGEGIRSDALEVRRLRGQRLKRAGVKPGLPDIEIWYWRSHHIEIKTGRGHLSKAQRDRIALLKAAGCLVEVCRSLAAIQAAVARWRIPLRAEKRSVERIRRLGRDLRAAGMPQALSLGASEAACASRCTLSAAPIGEAAQALPSREPRPSSGGRRTGRKGSGS